MNWHRIFKSYYRYPICLEGYQKAEERKATCMQPVFAHGPVAWPQVFAHGPVAWPRVFAHGSVAWPQVFAHGSIAWPQVFAHGSIAWPQVFAHGSIAWPQVFAHGSIARVFFTMCNCTFAHTFFTCNWFLFAFAFHTLMCKSIFEYLILCANTIDCKGCVCAIISNYVQSQPVAHMLALCANRALRKCTYYFFFFMCNRL